MGFSEIPPPPELNPGQDEPVIAVRPPGPQSRSWIIRHAHVAAPMGPKPPKPRTAKSGIVYSTAKGSNVIDVDGNRFVDLAAGFGAMLIGHSHPNILRALELQGQRLLQALGDVYPAEAKIALCERLAKLYPQANAKVIIGQSGADAVSAALKTAVLHSKRPGVIAFHGAYHGLSYGPLATCGLRASYREPFSAQLNPEVRFLTYPANDAALEETLEAVRFELASGSVGAVLAEPILGRGGVVVPPPAFLPELARLAHARGALLIADEIWTGLGRSGKMLFSGSDEFVPDLICLGKGLGGGLPLSAVIGRTDVMQAWQQDAEVVHTSTFAGAPLACTTAIATLDVLSREGLVERANDLGARLLEAIARRLSEASSVREVRGAGLMIGIDLGDRPGAASRLQKRLLESGYITSTGGGQREVLVLTPPLNISEPLVFGFVEKLFECVQASEP